MNQSEVTACLVTRGNVDIRPILDSLIFYKVIVWDNSKRDFDAATYGRYMAAEEADTELVYFQDDDVILSPEGQQELLDQWQPGEFLVSMEDKKHRTEFSHIYWCGQGAITERRLYREAFDRWGKFYSKNEPGFHTQGCDIVFPVLTPNKRRINVGRTHLSYAHGLGSSFQAG